MAEADDIILRIALSGQDDVVARLGQIGEAGVGVMQRLESAVTGGTAVFAGLTAAITGVGAGLFYWANSSSKAIDQMGNLAAQSGTTISQMSALTQTLSAAGANTDQLGSAFRRLSFTIEAQWQQIALSVKKGANDAINEQFKLKDSSLAVEDAQERLYQAQLKRGQLQGKEQSPAEKQAHDLANATREVERAVNDLAKAEQAEREAREAAEHRQRNDINTVKDAIKAITEGRQTYSQALQSADLGYQNVINGIIASAGPAGDAIQNFNGNLSDLIGKSPSVKDVFYQLADFFKNSGDDALNTAVAYKVLGRGIGQDVIEALKQGSAALKENEERLTKLGLVLSDTDKKVAKDFTQSFHSLSGELVTTIHQIGTFFAPAFTEGFNTFRKFIEDNHSTILAFAQDVAARVKPIILDFFNVISGRDAQTEWIQQLVEGLRAVGNFIRSEVIPAIEGFFNALTGGESDPGSRAEVWQKRFEAFGSAIKGGFEIVGNIVSAVIKLLDKAAGLFNKIFGTEVTGGQIAIVGLIAQVTGALGLLTGAANTAFVAVSKLLGLGGGAIGGALAGAAGGAAGAGAGAGQAGFGVLSGAARTAAGLEAAGISPDTFQQMMALTRGRGGEGTTGALLLGGVQGIGAALTQTLVAALGSPGIVAAVGAAIGALFVLGIKSSEESVKKQLEDLRKGKSEKDPFTFLGMSIPDWLLPPEARRGTGEEFAEQQRLRRLGFSADRTMAERELSPDQRRARDLYTNYDATPYFDAGSGRVRERMFEGLSGRSADLRALLSEWQQDFYRRQQDSVVRGPGVPPSETAQKSQLNDLLDQMMRRDADAKGDRAADKQAEAADKQLRAADKQGQAADKRQLPGKSWTAEDERKAGWTEEDQRAFEIHGGPGADYYARFGVAKADPRGGGGEGAAASFSEASDEARQLGSSLDSVGTAASSLASSFTNTAGALESVAARLASIQLPEPQRSAEGGLVSGPGGPKDDLIPAMLSDGEFVITADGSNLTDAMRHFGRRFAFGGLASLQVSLASASPALATPYLPSMGERGLPNTDLRPVAINFPGQRQVSGLFGTRAAIDQLARAAADHTLSSAGRKPSWYE